MDCTARVVREKKIIPSSTSKKPTNFLQIYCPILGEINLMGDEAEKVRERMKARDKEEV
jgi:hypothetical protein